MKKETFIFVHEDWKHYAVSSLITFIAGFCFAVLPLLDKLTAESLGSGALFSLLFTGLRAGLKLAIEGFLGWYATRK